MIYYRICQKNYQYMGLVFMNLSGYNLKESVEVWKRMKEEYKGQEPPEWMSTHPSSSKRIVSLNEWIPEIIRKDPPIKKLS